MSIFDIDGAFELGFSETAIAKALSSITGFDYDAAMQRGRRYSDGGKLTDRDIIEYLRGSTRQGYDVGAALDATAGFIKSTPPSILGAIGTLARDEDPYAEQNRFTEWERAAEQKTDEFRQRIEGKEHYPVIPGIATVEDVGTAADSVGHSLVGMGPSVLGSVGSGLSNIAPTPQTKVAGKTLSTLGGMLGSAVTIGKIDAKAVGKQLIDAADMEMLAEEGRLLGPEERKALLDNTRELRNEHALWEAGPEAAGNAIEMVGLGKILTGALKGKGLVSAVKKVVGGGAMNLGAEYATETTTGVFQQPVEVELGLSEDKEKWSPTDPKAWKESFKEQLGPTTLLVGALGASAGGIGATGRLARAGADKVSGRAPQKQSALVDQVPGEYKQLFVGAAQRYGVPLDFLISIAKNESSFNPRAESGTGPQGIMQISRGKQKDWGVKDPFDPVESVDVAAREIAKYMRAYDGDMDTVAAVYNQGEGYAKTWRDNADARSYVSKINRTMGDQAVLAGQRRDLAALEDYASALPGRTEEMRKQARDAGGDYRQRLIDAAGLAEPSEAEWQRALAKKDDIVTPLGDLGTEAAVAAEQDSTPEGYTLGRDVAGTRYADVGVDPASTERMINEASFERNSGLGMPVTEANSTLARQDALTEAQRIAEAQDDARRLYDEHDRATFTPAADTQGFVRDPKGRGEWAGRQAAETKPKTLRERIEQRRAPQQAVRNTGGVAFKSREDAELKREFAIDHIATIRAKGQQPRQQLHDIVAAADEYLATGSVSGGVAGEQVFGHPQATNILPTKYGNLIPIKVRDRAAVERRIDAAQALFDEVAQDIGQTRFEASKGNKRAKLALKSADFREKETAMELLRDETMPSLNRLLKQFPEDAKTRKDADMADAAETDFENMDQPAKEPWQMTRKEYYQHIRTVESPGRANNRPFPDWKKIEEAVGFGINGKGKEVQPLPKQRLVGGFTKEQEEALRVALGDQGYAVDKTRVRNQEEQGIPAGGGWRARGRDVFPTSPEHERSVRAALADNLPVPASVLADYPELANAKTRKDADMADVPETDFGNIKEGEIYPTTVSGKKMYAIRGDNPRGGGDSLFGTREEAQAEIERAAKMKAANGKSRVEAKAKEDAKDKAATEREAKRKAELAGKQTLWFDEEYIAGLSAMARGRLMKALDKRYNTRDGERTLREYIESGGFTGTNVSEVPAVQYDRAKYNRMDSREQAEYDKRLEEKKTEYRVTRDDDTSFQIPKIVFDAIRKDAAQEQRAEGAASGQRQEGKLEDFGEKIGGARKEDGRPVESNYKSAREYLAALQQWREETGNANEYEQRREDRASRIDARADKLNSEAAAAFERSAKIGERFHGGQPILVGHHSEKSARAAQAKMHSAMDKSVDLGKQADEAAYRAEAARRNKAISSDDEDAIVKLKAKIEAAEELQAQYKAINKALRKKDTVKGDEELAALGLSEKGIAELRSPTEHWRQPGIPSYRLQNNNANIKRMKDRVADLERNQQDETQEFEFDGGKIIDNVEDNRVQIDFDGKPSAELREALKGSAFAWAPSVSMWQRKRGGNALYAAKRIVGLVEDGPKLSTTALPPSARANVRQELESILGKLRTRKLLAGGRVTILKSQAEAKTLVARLGGKRLPVGDTSALESLPDSVVADAKHLADLIGTDTFFSETNGGVKTPVEAAQLRRMRRFVKNDEVGRVIIQSIPVDMMDFLSRGKASASESLHDDAMLRTLFPFNGDNPVSFSVDVSNGLASIVAGLAAKISESTTLDVARPALKDSSAVIANKKSPSLPALDGAVEDFRRRGSLVGNFENFPTLGASNISHNSSAGFVGRSIPQNEQNATSKTFDDNDVEITAKFSKDGKIQGFYLNGKAYLVEDGVAEGDVMGVLMHEFGEHAAQLGFKNNLEYRLILKSLEKRQNEQSATGEAIRAAMQRVPKDTAVEHQWSEVAAYLVENNADQGLSLVNRLVAFFKKWLYKAGAISADKLTHKDLAAFAYSAVRAEARRSGKLAEGGRVADVALSRQQQAEASETRAAKTNGLPMDFDSRMARAREMGFDTDTVFSHASWTDPVIERILAKDTTFDGLFAVEGEESSHGGPHQHRFIVKTHFDHADLSRSFRNDDAPFKEVVKRELGEEPGTNEDWSLLEDLVLENEFVHELWSDEDSVPTFFKEALGGYISGDLLADISWNIQKLRGKVAKEYGADAIDMTDEHGTSVLLLPGSGVRSLKAAFDPSYVESDQLLRSMAENLGVTAEQLQREYDAVVKRYKGTDQWLKAPNGKKSNLNERQWVLVRTPRFKEWFGDWENDPDNASKVVDANGEPLAVYHGTGSDVAQFNRMAWGSADPRLAGEYAEMRGEWYGGQANVMPVYMNIRRPFDADTLDTPASFEYPDGLSVTRFIDQIIEQSGVSESEQSELRALEQGIRAAARQEESGPSYSPENFWYRPAMLFGKDGSRQIRRVFEIAGFDGVRLTEQGAVTYGAFSPTQIKSATGNTGAFDGSNQDIRYSIASAATNTFTGAKGRLEQILENSPEWRDRWERFIYNFIDSNDPRTRVWKRAGSPTDSEMVTLERLRGKKAAADQKEFHDEMVTPLLKKMKEGGLKEGDLEEYAHAMHTPERNERMRRVNAKRTLDSLLGEMTEAERREYDEQVELLRKGGKRDGWDTEDIQDSYLQMIDEIFDELAFREAEHRRAEQEYEDRVWTDEELEKATPERLRKRLDSVADRLEKSRKIKERWQKESIRFAGMTDAEAASIVKKWKADKRFDVVESARKDMAEISAKTLAVLRESGDISQEEFEAMSIGYKYYVPLHRDGFQDTRPATGRMTGPTGKPFKVAKGSMSEVVSILGNVIRAHDTAISRKHKLSAGRALYEFALAYPEAGITVEKQEQQPTHDREGNVSMYTSQTEPVDGVFVKVDGKRHLLRFAVDERTPEGRTLGRMLDSIKGADTQMGSLMSMLHTVTRFLAMVNTSLSPEFVITNFSRDFQTAFVHLSQEDIDKPGLKKAIAKDIVPAIKGIWAAENGKKDSDMAKWYADFAKNGGKVGWMQGYESIRELEGKLKSEMDLYGEGMRAKKAMKKVLRTIDAANTAIENGVRLATYKNLVDNGVSKQQAALISSSLTVDFTQRGKMGSQINALYMFANASIQGSVRVAHALAKSPRVRKIAGGIVMTGFSMQMLALTSGGDDDSGNPYILGVPDHIRERSMLLMVPGTEGKFMRVPMAYGYNVFYNFGAEIANSLYMSIMGKKYNHGQGAMRVVSAALDSFNPINSATLLQTIAPTLVDPFVYVAENKAWHGGDLRPKQNPFGPKTPESQRAWKSTSPVFKGMAEGLNWVTGGDKYEGGLVDISPEVFELAWETATGSMGRFVTNTLSLPLSAAKGDLEANKVPFLRTVYGSWDERSISNRYYETMERAQTAKLRVDGAKTLKERRDAVRSQDYQLYKVAESTEKRIKRLRKALRQKEASGDKKEAERLKKRIVDLQASVLARVN